jgi:hypothetical protein
MYLLMQNWFSMFWKWYGISDHTSTLFPWMSNNICEQLIIAEFLSLQIFPCILSMFKKWQACLNPAIVVTIQDWFFSTEIIHD